MVVGGCCCRRERESAATAKMEMVAEWVTGE